MIVFYKEIVNDYHIISIEDGMGELDYEGCSKTIHFKKEVSK